MNESEKIEFAKFVIGRYDHYYDSVNNKANFWLAFNSFAIGVVLTTYKDVKDLVPSCVISWFNGGLISFLVIAIVSSFLILIASWPHMTFKKRPGRGGRSLIYFDDVAAFEVADYRKALDEADSQRLYKDFSGQTWHLAAGLNRKYRLLAWAGRLMAMLLVILAYLILVFVVGKILNQS